MLFSFMSIYVKLVQGIIVTLSSRLDKEHGHQQKMRDDSYATFLQVQMNFKLKYHEDE